MSVVSRTDRARSDAERRTALFAQTVVDVDSGKWDKALDWKPPHAQWFVGGKLNVSANCLDRHLDGPRRDARAIIWEGEPGDERTLTYAELHAEVARMGNALRSLGVKKGDRVAIYLPMIPEAAIAMLACARIGAIHSVVFGGFSPESLRDRINDSECKALITADGSYRRGQVIQLKRNADIALEDTPSIENVIVVQRWRHAILTWCEQPGEAGHH